MKTITLLMTLSLFGVNTYAQGTPWTEAPVPEMELPLYDDDLAVEVKGFPTLSRCADAIIESKSEHKDAHIGRVFYSDKNGVQTFNYYVFVRTGVPGSSSRQPLGRITAALTKRSVAVSPSHDVACSFTKWLPGEDGSGDGVAGERWYPHPSVSYETFSVGCPEVLRDLAQKSGVEIWVNRALMAWDSGLFTFTYELAQGGSTAQSAGKLIQKSSTAGNSCEYQK